MATPKNIYIENQINHTTHTQSNLTTFETFGIYCRFNGRTLLEHNEFDERQVFVQKRLHTEVCLQRKLNAHVTSVYKCVRETVYFTV